ncbi:hypothetical protein DFH08DRAFT_412308 [Mycena albidolilacea]|uniref:Uncharacterized protein n=1 Tax=Mycena albidolilacea TaxID=1033008 RepID=A0AAD7AIA3_9AGAR|nr:hypothetical protein DFH08DRAFT_412308 [Mycena albidolilacea]
MQYGARFSPKAIVRKDIASSGLVSASWIWTASPSAPGNVAFLKSYDSPAGKSASSAIISITAVESWTLWVNGQPIGASGTSEDDWKSAHVLRAALNSTQNIFSVLVSPGNDDSTPPGLLVAIQVAFADSSNSIVLSDSSWLASRSIPLDFPTPSTLSQFVSVAVEASYGSGSWGQSVTLRPSDPSPLTLQDSTWIWSTTNAFQEAALGKVGFRKVLTNPSGKTAQSATALITADNTFSFYLGQTYIGSPPADPNFDYTTSIWFYPQQFTIKLDSKVNTFNIIADNFPTADTTTNLTSAGLIGAIQIHYTDGSSDIVRTDSSWLTANVTSPTAFLSTSDSLLSPAIAQGPLGMSPWGPFIGVADALDAASVPTPPFNTSRTTTASPKSHPIPVAAIVAPIISVLAVVGMIIAFFYWKSSRSSKNRPGFNVTPFSSYTAVPSIGLEDTSSFRAAPSQTHATAGDDGPPPDYSYGESAQSLGLESEPLVSGGSRRKQRR